MLHDPTEQLKSLVDNAVAALLLLPDEERADLLTEMRTVVFKRASEAFGLRHGHAFAAEFVNAVALRLDAEWQAQQSGNASTA